MTGRSARSESIELIHGTQLSFLTEIFYFVKKITLQHTGCPREFFPGTSVQWLVRRAVVRAP